MPILIIISDTPISDPPPVPMGDDDAACVRDAVLDGQFDLARTVIHKYHQEPRTGLLRIPGHLQAKHGGCTWEIMGRLSYVSKDGKRGMVALNDRELGAIISHYEEVVEKLKERKAG